MRSMTRAVCFSAAFLITISFILTSTSAAQNVPATGVNVTTYHNDIGRTGLNSNETVLTPTNVNKTQFGKTCSAPVDGQIYAQPLVMTNVTINGTLYASVVYVATQNDSVYAFDANSTGPTCTQLLFTNLLQSGESGVSCTYFGGKHCGAIQPIIGILGTPVIDPTAHALYLVSQAQVGNPPTSWVHRLHALNITNFSEMFNGPAIVAGSYGPITFSSSNHIQRPGLLLLPGNPPSLYAGFSLIDGLNKNPPSGWIFKYNPRDLSSPPTVFATAPNGLGAGIWQGGGGIAAGLDETGGQTYLFFGTADGTFDADIQQGQSDYGDSFVKLTTDLSTVAGYFTPFNQTCMFQDDEDYGSGGVMLVPPGVIPAHPYIAVSGSKDGSFYVVDRENPGGYHGSDDCTGINENIQTISGLQEIHNEPAYWNKNLFFAPTVSAMLRYTLSSTCSPGPVCTKPMASKVTFPPGVTPSITANGNNVSTGIVWAIWGDRAPSGGPPAILYALNPQTMAEIYDSSQCGTQDTAGLANKFAVPTVANGKVFVGTQTELDIYGELSTTRTCP